MKPKTVIVLQSVLFFTLFSVLAGFLFHLRNQAKGVDPLNKQQKQMITMAWVYTISASVLFLAYLLFVFTQNNDGNGRHLLLGFLLIASVALLLLGRDQLRRIRKSIPPGKEYSQFRLFLDIGNYLSVGIAVLSAMVYVYNTFTSLRDQSPYSEPEPEQEPLRRQYLPRPKPRQPRYQKLPTSGYSERLPPEFRQAREQRERYQIPPDF